MFGCLLGNSWAQELRVAEKALLESNDWDGCSYTATDVPINFRKSDEHIHTVSVKCTECCGPISSTKADTPLILMHGYAAVS